jgi:hypothetical protein
MTDILTLVFGFIYTIGYFIGGKVVWIIESISGINVPNEVTNTIGLLTILTIFLSLVDVAKKIVWTIVTIGWVLIILRIVMLMVGI